ncbi:amino acid deaminase [Zophobihabitans entericus]|uniref:Amino acid deaminase n=1 Tax=Zophobihabitans entericus TaxID=1635327 RepID=A0A6G9IDF3_9GAMM|nr:amino acid deaminase [Zophobihabitans entericus]QIQ21734.1 amino acid deaminase [Zophobihabitans entericus]
MKNQLISGKLDHKAAAMSHSTDGQINILNEDVCLPVVVIKEQILDNNIRWMQDYTNACQVSLAPHGKTTMTPAIFKKQLQAGAWGIGVGTAYQAKIAIESGITNIIMANQLIGKANMLFVSKLKQQSNTKIFCCVDNKGNALQLSTHFAAQEQTMNVLLELGIEGGRCGCRSESEAIELAKYIHSLPGLKLSGVEFYEGVIHSQNELTDIDKINGFLTRVINTSNNLIKLNLFPDSEEVILTGAGSVWYDLVCQQMQQANLGQNIRYVIRPGCYVTQDKGVYQQSHNALKNRSELACHIQGDLASAMELCAFVQSMPEPDLAIIGFGKRDAAFDEGLPQPIAHYRHGQAMPFVTGTMKTQNIMDQHAMLHYSKDVDLQVGDILIFGTSHPCITFDKWRQLYFVDGQYNVLEAVETYF